MAEEEGFEPPRAVKPLSVFKTDPFSQTWVLLQICDCLDTGIIIQKKYFFVNCLIKKDRRAAVCL